MKYPQLHSLVPEGEFFDESAINEGVFLSVGHVNSIEQTLLNAGTAVESVQNKLETANATISTLEESAIENANTISTQAQRITELESEVATLNAGKQPSGKGSVVVTKDEVVVEEKSDRVLPRYDSADHPANRAARRFGK